MSARLVDPVRRRAMVLGAVLLSAAILYIASFAVLRPVVRFEEASFASAGDGGDTPVDVYVDIIAIDPVRESLDLRLDVADTRGAGGKHYDAAFDRDVELRLSDGASEQGFRIVRNEPATSRSFTATIRGSIGRYPFDRYGATLVFTAHELSSKAHRPLPVRVTVWKGVANWVVSVTSKTSGRATSGLPLAVTVSRPVPDMYLACVLYGVMVLIAASALTVGTLVYLGIRRVEATLVGALTGMVFALPVVHNVLPGAPPLGVSADIFILLWAELLVAAGLALLVTAWAQRGPAP